MESSTNITKSFVEIGVKKSKYSLVKQIGLAFYGGMFIGIAGISSSIAAATIASPSLAKLLSSLVFPFGLIMIILMGAELFTSNSLVVIALAEKKISLWALIRSLVVVYIGNAIGAVFVVGLLYQANIFNMFGGDLALYTTQLIEAKSNLSFLEALSSAVLCNILVCFAVWMSNATTKPGAKLFILFAPTMLFVLGGFEHVVANFYYWPAGIVSSIITNTPIQARSWSFLLTNILPVTIGNIIGGMGFVGLGSWLLFSNKKKTKA